MTDEQLRQALLDAPDTALGEEPLDTERLARAARGELPPDEVAALVDRIAGDPVALSAWILARELAAPAEADQGGPKDGGPGEEAPTGQVIPFPSRVSAGRWLAGAGLAVALAAGAVLFAKPFAAPPVAEPTYRGDRSTAATPTVERVGDGVRVRFAPVPGASHAVLLLDDTLAEVARFDRIQGDTLELADQDLAGLAGRGQIQLVVTDASGTRRSPPVPLPGR